MVVGCSVESFQKKEILKSCTLSNENGTFLMLDVSEQYVLCNYLNVKKEVH